MNWQTSSCALNLKAVCLLGCYLKGHIIQHHIDFILFDINIEYSLIISTNVFVEREKSESAII